MDQDRRRLLGIYLNDHRAGAAAALRRARSTRDASRGTDFAEPLTSLCGELESDLAGLEAVMRDLGVERSHLKPSLAALGEKAGRLKPNGQLRGYSPVGRLIDLEVLILATTGKLRLWTLLKELAAGETSADLDELIRRARDQRTTIEELQLRAAALL
jgi:hypothetical protein